MLHEENNCDFRTKVCNKRVSCIDGQVFSPFEPIFMRPYIFV